MTCPICAKDSDPKYRPFCSRRCADIDLGRWLTGSYAIPGEPLVPGAAPSSDTTDDEDPPPRHPSRH